MVHIEIINEKCDGCGECVDICPSEVFAIRKEKAIPENNDECVECCACVEVCPKDAINHESC